MKNLLPRLLVIALVAMLAGPVPATVRAADDGAVAEEPHAAGDKAPAEKPHGADDGHTADSKEGHGKGHPEGHGEGHDEGQPSLLSFDPDLAIFSVVVFAILFAVLWKFAWGPISDGLDKRENMIAQQIAEAKESNEKAAALLAQYDQKIADSVEEARVLVAQGKADAEAARQQILADAEASATRERERAVADIQNAKETALQEIAQQSIDRAVALASGIVSRELRPDDHAQLIRETMEQFPSQN